MTGRDSYARPRNYNSARPTPNQLLPPRHHPAANPPPHPRTSSAATARAASIATLAVGACVRAEQSRPISDVLADFARARGAFADPSRRCSDGGVVRSAEFVRTRFAYLGREATTTSPNAPLACKRSATAACLALHSVSALQMPPEPTLTPLTSPTRGTTRTTRTIQPPDPGPPPSRRHQRQGHGRELRSLPGERHCAARSTPLGYGETGNALREGQEGRVVERYIQSALSRGPSSDPRTIYVVRKAGRQSPGPMGAVARKI